MASPASYPIESVENAARVLLMLRTQPVMRVAEVALELGIARSSAHRMLTTLQAHGLLRQDPATRGYAAGPQLVQIGAAVMGVTDLRAEARSTMESLARSIGETVHLIVLEGSTILFLDGVEGHHAIRAAIRTGDRAPAHASAAGKVLLAALTGAQLRERYPSGRIKGGTTEALGTRSALEGELAEVRQQGVATNLSESELGLHAVAVPVRDSSGGVRAAMSVSGPSVRLTEAALAEHARTMQDAVAQLSASLS